MNEEQFLASQAQQQALSFQVKNPVINGLLNTLTLQLITAFLHPLL